MTKVFKSVCLITIMALVLSMGVSLLPASDILANSWLRPPDSYSGAWTNMGNADADDDADISGVAGNQAKYYYTFNLDSGSSIEGIEVLLDDAWCDSSGDSIGVELSWDDGTSNYTTSENQVLGTTDADYTLGGATDLWGHAWTVSEINSGLCVRLTANSTDPNYVYLDYLPVTVYYTPLDADFSADPTTAAVSENIQFTDESAGDVTSWSWDFDEDSTEDSTDQNPTYAYTEPGTYDVSLEINGGDDTETKTDYITVTEADFSADPLSGDAPLEVDFTDLSTNATTYDWDFDGDGTTDSTAPTPSPYTYYMPGTYDVSLTINDGLNGEHTETKADYITVNASQDTVWVDDDWASGYSPGDTVYVNGSPYTYMVDAFSTIQDGIDAVIASTVYVLPGEYIENIVIEKNLNLIATEGYEETIINGGGGESVILVDLDDQTALIQGFTLRYGGLSTGIHSDSITGGSELTITECQIIENSSAGIHFVTIEDGSSVAITDNIVSENYGYGINVENLTGASNVTITGNTLEDNYDNGVNFGNILYDSTVTIEDNTIAYNYGDGILTVDIEDATVTIEDNAIVGNGYSEPETGMYFEYIYGDSIVDITGNIVSGNYGGGIQFYVIYEDAVVNITDNKIEESLDTYSGIDADGINLEIADGNAEITIEDNEITDNEGDGIDIEHMGGKNSPSVDIICNTISGNADDGVDVNYQEHDYMVTVSPCNDIFDNEGYGINNDGYDGNYGWIDATENWWGDPSGPGGEGPGEGDEVTDYVEYGEEAGYGDDDWLPAPCEEECVAPGASLSASATMGDAPLTVQFRGYSDQSYVEYNWSFGTGDSSDSRSPSYTFQFEGTYEVTLEVTNECGASSYDRVVITVEDGGSAPTLTVTDLNISPVYAYYGEPVYITATVSNQGGSWGSDDVELLINGQFEQSFPVGLAAGTSQTIDFTVYKTEAREYQVTIGTAAGTFYLLEEGEQSTQSSGLLAGGDLGTGGIIAIVCIAVILVAGIVLVFVFARRS